MLDWNAVKNKLQARFDPKDIRWRVGQSGEFKGNPWIKIMPYISTRDVQNRLDEAVGPQGWQNNFITGASGGILCGIGIYDSITESWIWKYDGADNTDIEAIKGGISDSMKRAGVQWGIGRYLYEMGEFYADIVEKGEHKSKVKINGKDQYLSWNVPSKAISALTGPAPAKKPAEKKEAAAKPAKKQTAPEGSGSNAASNSGNQATEDARMAEVRNLARFLTSMGAKTVEDYDTMLYYMRSGVIENPKWAEIKENPQVDLADIKSEMEQWLKINATEVIDRKDAFAVCQRLAEMDAVHQ